MKYRTYDAILQGDEATEANARDYARDAVFEGEAVEQTIAHARHVDTVNGIEIHYDYGADYYFFCPAE